MKKKGGEGRTILTIFDVGHDEVVPFSQESPTAGTRRAVEILLLRFACALDGILEIFERAVGDLAEHRCSRRLWGYVGKSGSSCNLPAPLQGLGLRGWSSYRRCQTWLPWLPIVRR